MIWRGFVFVLMVLSFAAVVLGLPLTILDPMRPGFLGVPEWLAELGDLVVVAVAWRELHS